MRNDGVVKNQHYVPQFILKRFCSGNKPQIWVFDKHKERSFKTNIRNIASESSFYDIDINNIPATFEYSLSELEAKVSPIIKRIIKKGEIGSLSLEEKIWLSYFFAVQLLRTKKYREGFREVDKLLKEWLSKNNHDITQIQEYQEVTEETVKIHGLKSLSDSKEFAVHFLEKTWVLMKSRPGFPFITSDHPVCMQNMIDFGPRGNLGLKVKGIEIYFPLSKTYCLSMICPSYEEQIFEGCEKLKKMTFLNPSAASNFNGRAITEIAKGIEHGTAVQAKDESILNMNSLHVRNSWRFIFSPINDFEMVKDILKENPDLKTGLTMQLG